MTSPRPWRAGKRSPTFPVRLWPFVLFALFAGALNRHRLVVSEDRRELERRAPTDSSAEQLSRSEREKREAVARAAEAQALAEGPHYANAQACQIAILALVVSILVGLGEGDIRTILIVGGIFLLPVWMMPFSGLALDGKHAAVVRELKRRELGLEPSTELARVSVWNWRVTSKLLANQPVRRTRL